MERMLFDIAKDYYRIGLNMYSINKDYNRFILNHVGYTLQQSVEFTIKYIISRKGEIPFTHNIRVLLNMLYSDEVKLFEPIINMSDILTSFVECDKYISYDYTKLKGIIDDLHPKVKEVLDKVESVYF